MAIVRDLEAEDVFSARRFDALILVAYAVR
jgi:hypothetical protein